MKSLIPSKEGAVGAALTALTAPILALLTAFGVHITADQTKAITSVASAVIVALLALTTADRRDIPLTPPGG